MKKVIGALLLSGLAFGNAIASVPNDIQSNFNSGNYSKVESLIKNEKKLSKFEADSLCAIMSRIRSDFRLSYTEGIKAIQQKFPHVTKQNIDNWIAKKYIEVKNIDGELYMYRKTVSNLDRLVPELSKKRRVEHIQEDKAKAVNAENAIKNAGGKGLSEPHNVTLKFSATVHADAVPAGETVRVWLPFPINSERQSDATLISSSDNVVYSKGAVHNTVYMEKKAISGKETYFECVVSYKTRSQYYSPEYILKNKKEYNRGSELYKKYTKTELPHIIITDSIKALAESIVGTESDSFKQASLIYEWVDAYFPWAGAREYSTIPNMPNYVLENGHGDCGQVSLLYITLLRSLGIPARWESGYMLDETSAGMHDWAEVYYEGIGWVPVDMSFGLLEVASEEKVCDFYKTGLDEYRFASNKGVNGKLYPEKQYVRSETVDFQLGEVEWKGGNLFYYKDWTPKVELIKFE